MTQSDLLDRLEAALTALLQQTRQRFADQPKEALSLRPASGQWNALECFAHLNAQYDYYLPQIELALHKAKARKWMPQTERQSSWFGRRAIRAVDPANLPGNPRKSPKKIDPGKLLPVRDNETKVLLINLEMLLRLVKQAREVDLNRPRVKSQRWRLFSFYLGDLLEYLCLHTQRHVLQASQAITI